MADICCVHCIKDEKHSDLIHFSETRWDSTIKTSKEWICLDGEEQAIAEKLLSLECKPDDVLYHERCYVRYTNRRRLQQAKNRLRKWKESGVVGLSPLKSRSKRQKTDSSARRSKHILPQICLICRKTKWKQEKVTGKRSQEKLVQGGPRARTFYESALKMQREDIIKDINFNSDLLAVEAKYHNSCYRQFMHQADKVPNNVTSSSTQDLSATFEERPLQKSFQAFCKEIIEPHMQKGTRMYSMKRLTQLFREKVREVEHITLSAEYKSSYLKSRLQAVYPNITFARQNRRNKPHVAFFSKANETIVLDSQLLSDNSDDSCSTDNDMDSVVMENCQAADVTLETERTSHVTNHQRSADSFTSFTQPHNSTNYTCHEQYDWRTIYFASLAIRNAVKTSPIISSWPPSPADMTEEKLMEIVPPQLFNLIAWICGLAKDFANSHVIVDASVKNKILSIGQNIMSLANKNYIPPKHIMLGMSVRHVTGSQRIVNILNGLGHSVSQTTLQRLDTDIASLELKNNVPTTLQKNNFTSLVWDNIDFSEETINGENTTHCVNGIAVQTVPLSGKTAKEKDGSNTHTSKLSQKRSRKKALEPVEKGIVPFPKRKRAEPEILEQEHNHEAEEEARELGRKKDMAYFLLKFMTLESDKDHLMPSWTGFNTATQTHIPHCSFITYLPVIDANATDMSTVNTILHRSMNIANDLNLKEIVVVADQAIYAKAQQIRWGNTDMKQKIVLRLGEFHTLMAFLAAIGKRFHCSGLEEILLDAGIVAGGSMSGVISGRHYNRAIRAHTLLCEALERLRWDTFLQNQSSEDQESLRSTCETFLHQWTETYEEALTDDILGSFLSKFEEHNSELCRQNSTYMFWSSYIDMVHICLRFLRGTREGNWYLHLASVNDMLPWLFALDRVNYARYLTMYYYEMTDLPATHPDTFQHMEAGEFSVQRQTSYGFAKVALDQTIEQTINKDAKAKSGWKGFSMKKNAVCRWIMSSHARGAITRHCEQLAGQSRDEQELRKDLEPAVMMKMENMVSSLLNSITSRINPFAVPSSAASIVNISSGFYASDAVTKNLLSAHELGGSQLKQFVQERVISKQKSLFDPVKRMQLATFSKKTPTSKLSDKKSTVTSSNSLLSRLLLISQEKPVDLEHILTYSLTEIPHVFGNADGTLTKTNKSDLVHVILKDGLDIQTPARERPVQSALILDGMVLLRQLKGHLIPETFAELAIVVLDAVVHKATAFGASRVDVVFDTYPETSIKDCEQRRRIATAGIQIFHLSSEKQKVPKNFQQYLSSGKNKTAFIRFLFEQWQRIASHKLKGLQLLFAHEDTCHILNEIDGKITVSQVTELQCDHQEADTRLLLHAQHASQSSACVTIFSPDTDVFVLAVSCIHSFDNTLYMQTSSNDIVYNISDVKKIFNEATCQALLGLHCFTGCDSVSCFRGKGKKTAYKMLKKFPEYISYFAELGKTWQPSDQLCQQLEQFVCCLYGIKSENSVNRLRFLHFCRKKNESNLPPNQDALLHHTRRACYQAAIYRRCLLQHIKAPVPESHGWNQCDGKLCISWMSLPAVPPVVTDFIQCNCKSGCSNGRCVCQKHELLCTNLCGCQGCFNISEQPFEDNSVTSDSEQCETESDSESEESE